MTMRMRLFVVLSALLLTGCVCHAQNKKDEVGDKPAQTEVSNRQHYQVVFVVQEVEGGKVINARRYITYMTYGPATAGSIRTGSKVPIATGPFSTDGKAGVETQYTYVDLGFEVDYRNVYLAGDRMSLYVIADLSSADAPPSDGRIRQPTIRQNKWSSEVTVDLGKPTVIFSSDDMDSKRTMQVELTVTPVR